ncbi:MAG: hypothetical protein LBM28_01105 [Oscillospiraceae bacterium]|jgi:hypothetical protein|nr:hypothetical protein [Oscillospiraceae bacterium]
MEKALYKRAAKYLRITGCLAVGGVGALVIMCLFIGYGLHDIVGKEAVYTCLLLQAINIAVIRYTERLMRKSGEAPKPSKAMRRFRAVFSWLWRIGAISLLLSLGLLLFGLQAGSFWVEFPCIFGLCAILVGWPGVQLCLYRTRQSAIAAANVISRV